MSAISVTASGAVFALTGGAINGAGVAGSADVSGCAHDSITKVITGGRASVFGSAVGDLVSSDGIAGIPALFRLE